jgi:hypothetical protein
MVKATPKNTRRRHSKKVPDIPSTPSTPELLQAFEYFNSPPRTAPPPRPGDSKEQADTRAFLYCLMTDHPTGTSKTKSDYYYECRERFGISLRGFERIWNDTIDQTGAVAFRKSGPRGPHTEAAARRADARRRNNS